jgi:hypothetical protein
MLAGRQKEGEGRGNFALWEREQKLPEYPLDTKEVSNTGPFDL